MKIVLILIALLAKEHPGFADPPVFLFQSPEKRIIKALTLGKKDFIVTQNRLYVLSKNKVREVIALAFPCNDAVSYREGLLLATDSGLISYSPTTNSLSPFMPTAIRGKINAVLVDQLQRIWFSSKFSGAFIIDKDSAIRIQVQAPEINCMATTPDSSVWVGTNVGLYKIRLDGSPVARFAEEGIEGFDLPDNIIERLFAGERSRIWVATASALVYLSPDRANDDNPSFEYIGQKNNQLFSIAPVGEKDEFVFATSDGPVYLPVLYRAPESAEVHTLKNEMGYRLTNADLHLPGKIGGQQIIYVQTVKDYTWLITQNGACKVSLKKWKAFKK